MLTSTLLRRGTGSRLSASTRILIERKKEDWNRRIFSADTIAPLTILRLEEPPPHLLDSLIVINRLGITGRYPHNLEKVLEQYTKGQTQKLVNETQEILTWLIQTSLKR